MPFALGTYRRRRGYQNLVCKYQFLNFTKNMELEQTGQIGATPKGSMSFSQVPAGGANWSLECSVLDDRTTFCIACNTDCMGSEEAWTVTAEVTLAVGHTPSDLPFAMARIFEFNNSEYKQTVEWQLQDNPFDSIDFCKINIKVIAVTGIEDIRCWWHIPDVNTTPLPTVAKIRIRDRELHFIYTFSRYVNQLVELNPRSNVLQLFGTSAESFIQLHNVGLEIGDLEYTDEASIDLLVDAVVYFETEGIREVLVSEVRDWSFYRPWRYTVQKFFCWACLLGEERLRSRLFQ